MLKGKKKVEKISDLLREQLTDPRDPSSWSTELASCLEYPNDGSPEELWSDLQELEDKYEKSPEENLLWEMTTRLYRLISWYLNRPVTLVGGVGEKRAEALQRLDIYTIFDLVTHFPRAYTDRRYVNSIKDLSAGEQATVFGTVAACGVARGRRPRFEVRLSDDTGMLQVNFWNQTYLKDKISRGMKLFCSGKVESFRGTPQLNNPDFEIIERTEDLESSRTVKAIYPLTEGITQNLIRDWVGRALDLLEGLLLDCLPRLVRKEQKLPSYSWSLNQIHRPDSLQELDRARTRLKFEEFFFYQLLFVHQNWQVENIEKNRNYENREWMQQFLERVPFSLTADQRKALEKIVADLSSSAPIHRLLQGDVGTGKTVVAVASMLLVAASGWQTAFMAPTEVLAEQHFQKISQLLSDVPCRVELLIGSLSRNEKNKLQEEINKGEIDLVVGTHALVQEGVDFSNLGYVVIDEQHRFGVHQRRQLREKGPDIDMLIMSATPIPRSLALTAYGDLEITTLQECPTGAQKITTELYKQIPASRREVYEKVRAGLQEGERAFFVFPAIEDNESTELMAAADAYEKTEDSDFFGDDIEVGLVHGRMSREEKQDVMDRFRAGEIQLLYATTVIEVGIDVPEASYLVVHNAEQFGLAQLHQLRGRIGRAGQQAYCYLLHDPDVGEESRERLQVLERTSDGFEISRYDLKFRGIGNPAGTRQSGAIKFKLGNIWEDRKLMKRARDAGKNILQKYGGLDAAPLSLTAEKFNFCYEENQHYVKIG